MHCTLYRFHGIESEHDDHMRFSLVGVKDFALLISSPPTSGSMGIRVAFPFFFNAVLTSLQLSFDDIRNDRQGDR
jgi:hypothetical protein